MSGPRVLGVVLAGGRARRLGGVDKALVTLDGTTLLQRVCARLAPQCGAGLVVSANGPPERLGTPWPVLPDPVPDRPGPLAGLLAALAHARGRGDVDLVLTSAVDVPFVPLDLVERLLAAREHAGASVACAVCGDRLHPVQALWPLAVEPAIAQALAADERRVEAFARAQGLASAAWPTAPVDPFFNVNTPADVAAAVALLPKAP